jgi:glyoxylase-like metal-dependent hydrolase (beta-lactamase superfamily II)
MPVLHALCCGRLRFDRSLFFPEHPPGDEMTVPVPSFLVVHPKGTLLFDTGVDCLAATDPQRSLGRRLAGLFTMAGGTDESLPAQLARLGLDVGDITHVVNSHLHFDHCGCNALFPRAKFLLQRAELDAARAPGSHAHERSWNHPLDYRALDGEHDVFGDGAVVLLPTPGHTPGHQSMRVRVSSDRNFLLAADACYTQAHLDREIVPTAVWDTGQMIASMDALRKLGERSDTELIFGHDAQQWARMPQGPAQLS